MKRFLLAVPLAGALVAVLFAVRPGPLAGQSPRTGAAACCEKKDCPCPESCCSKKMKGDAAIVAELVAIMNETKSADTFAAALLALSRFDDKSPLPVVIRNAERLGLLKGLTKGDPANHVQEMIGDYLSGEMAAECEYPHRPAYPAPAPTYYPQAMSPWGPTPMPAPPMCVPPPPPPSGPLSLGCPVPPEKLGLPTPSAPAVREPMSPVSD